MHQNVALWHPNDKALERVCFVVHFQMSVISFITSDGFSIFYLLAVLHMKFECLWCFKHDHDCWSEIEFTKLFAAFHWDATQLHVSVITVEVCPFIELAPDIRFQRLQTERKASLCTSSNSSINFHAWINSILSCLSIISTFKSLKHLTNKSKQILRIACFGHQFFHVCTHTHTYACTRTHTVHLYGFEH